jgi:alanine-glyoxylate transaminase/serine-glyoxylate transaminase/serine-pyruvate transaminase
MAIKRGRNFLLTPGPTSIPERVLQAMARNVVDISSPEFVDFTRSCLRRLKPVFKTDNPVFLYTANGHGAWEAALGNTLSPGDHILVPGTGHFAENWAGMAQLMGMVPEITENDYRHAVDPNVVEEKLRADREQRIKAVLLVQTDTATGITSDVPAVRAAIDNAGHPALLMVDAVASLGTMPFEMDQWRIDVAVGASQKGLMAPPGLSFTAVSDKALEIAKNHPGPYSGYWNWQRRLEEEWYRWFCGTAPEHLLFGLSEAIDMLLEEGLEQAFARHQRLAEAVRAAVKVWGEAGVVGLNTLQPENASNAVTTIRLADGYDAVQIKAICHQHFNVSLGGGLSKLYGKAFRIGHMGDINEPVILGALGSVEAAFQLCGVPYTRGGVSAAVDYLAATVNRD